MLRSILIALSLFLHLISFAQTEDVEINQLYRFTVPEGKVVELTNSKFHKLTLSDGVFRSGSACNAAAYSNPKYLYGISYYENTEEDKSRPKTIGFTFNDINHYHDDIYQIKPYYLLTNDMGTDDLSKSLSWKFANQKIIFYPGTTIFPSSCIRSIVLTIRDMSADDRKAYDVIKRKRIELEMAQERRNALARRSIQQTKENRVKQKFEDPKSVYADTSIYNINQIKLSDSVIQPVLNAIVSQLEKLSNSEYTNLSDNLDAFAPLFIVGIWDNKGDIQSLKLVDERFYNKHQDIEITITENETVNLKQLLKLPNAPMVKYNDSVRLCYFEGYLTALKIMIKNKDHFLFKKTKKKFIYKTGYYSTNRELFENTFNSKYSPTTLGDYELSLVFANYQFTLLPELFAKQEKRELNKAIIFPYSR